MADSPDNRLGVGPLTASRVIRDAMGMLGQSFWRICAAAFGFFALPALIAVFAEHAVQSLSPDHGIGVVVIAYSAAVSAIAVRVLGPVAFAGFLDEAVAREYLHGEPQSLRHVMAMLPWRRLIVADVIVVVLVAIGLELFVLPGLITFGGIGLVGPVIVQEKQSVMPSLQRTVHLASRAPLLVGALIVTPFAIEQVVHEVVLHSLETSGIGVQLIAEWLLAVVLGGTLGLLEVALASELMARNPRTPELELRQDLVDDGQRPAVAAGER